MNLGPFLRVLTATCLLGTAAAAEPTVSHELPEKIKAVAEKLRDPHTLPGVSLAQGVSEITGVAISPLLGMSTVGAWTYFNTAESRRDKLPWYCHPSVWGAGLCLLGVCFLKDFLGAAAPALVKKPLDFVELFENKISALVACVGFVPLVTLALEQAAKWQPPVQSINFAASPSALLATAPLATVLDWSVHTPWVSIPVAMVGFTVVWLSSHALNVLIALSPFGIVDAGLKLTKLGLLALVAGSTALHPYAGAAVSLTLILVGLLLAGWSFRLTVFGAMMGSDFLLNRRATAGGVENGIYGFLARRLDGVPTRTLARLKPSANGGVTLGYRPWLLLPEKELQMPTEPLIVRRGLLHPALHHRSGLEPDAVSQNTLILLPRYRGVEGDIARHYGCQAVVDGTLLRGLKAVRQWLVGMLSTGQRLVEARPPQAG